jgi:hypothetical protein
MCTINGLLPVSGFIAEIRRRIMTERHGGSAYYHEAKYVPPKELIRMAKRSEAKPIWP